MADITKTVDIIIKTGRESRGRPRKDLLSETVNDVKQISKYDKQYISTTQKKNQATGKWNRTIRTTTRQELPKFRMEMLSVMFFGMQMQKTFTGLLEPSMKLVGVFEVFTAALELLFLPIALIALDWALAFLEWVSSLSDEEKTIYGFAVALLAIAGAVMGIVGQIGLFANGLEIMKAKMATATSSGMWSNFSAAASSAFSKLTTLISGAITKLGSLTGAAHTAFVAAQAVVGGIIGLEVGTELGRAAGYGKEINKHQDIASAYGLGWLPGGVQNAAGFGIAALTAAVGGDVRDIGITEEKPPGFQFGGVVPREGLYRLHTGETVTPDSGGGGVVFAPTINATGFTDSQMRTVANRLYDLMRQDLVTQTGRF